MSKKICDKKCSYIISYCENESVNFGEIKYFLEIDGYFYVVLNMFEIVSDCILNDLKIRLPNYLQQLKERGYFRKMYYSCKKTNNMLLLNVSSILQKCIVYEKPDGIFFICEFFNEFEHD